MEIAVSNRVIARNALGRFIADCQQAGHDTVDELIERGAKTSRRLAPRGSKHDYRTIPLAQSIESHMITRTSGVWAAHARHALHQEFGTGPHTMVGSPFFSFFWESAGRMWQAGLFGMPDIINHPGHGPQPYLRPAYEMIMAQAMAVARQQYPG